MGLAADITRAPKPYLYAEELARLTPWTVEAIETMKKRGILKCGEHYYQPSGSRGRLIFKWDAIVKLIEREAGGVAAPGMTVVCDYKREGSVLDVEKATARLRKLLD